jgi:hypothetical protein
MKRIAMFAVVTLMISTGLACGAEPHQEWMQFLKGTWTYEYSSMSSDGGALKGEVTYRPAAKRTAVAARGSDNEGGWAELIGWQSNTKTMVFNGYGSPGNYWHTACNEVSTNRLAGKTTGVLPNGKPVNGKVVIERVDDNQFEVHLMLEDESGSVKDVGKFTRVLAKDDK